MAISKFITLNSGIQSLVSGQQTSSGAAAGAIVALNSSSFVDTSIGGTGLNSSSAANGDVLIGNGSGFSLATLTEGSNITITNGAGTITIAASGGGSSTLTPASESSSFSALINFFYSVSLTSGSVVATLPDATSCAGQSLLVQVSATGTSHNLSLATVSTQTINGSAAASLYVLTNVDQTFFLISDGANWWTNSPTVDLSENVVNVLSVPNGGTGRSTLTVHNVIIGNGTSAVSQSAPSATSGIPLVSNGSSSDPTFSTATVPGGGTGLTSLTAHDLLVGAGTSNITLVAPSATVGIPLVSGGSSADPSYTTAVVAGGGTGLGTLTAHAVLLGEGTSNVSFATVGTAGRVLTDNGASDPTFQAPTATPNTITVLASASIAAGALVNIYDNAGTANIRPADNTSSSTPANAFAPSAISSAASGIVVPFHGPISGLSGLTPGTNYFLGTSGGLTTTAPSTSGDVIQTVGIAITASTFQFFAGTVNNIA